MLNISTEQVTPNLAAQYMKTVANNRKISRSVVQKYALAMKRGEWRATGQPIIFDATGRMIDGQHRCKAVEASGVPIEVVIVRNAPADSFAVIDTGKRRSGSDALSIAGKKNVNQLAAGARAIEYMLNGAFAAGSALTNARVLEITEQYPTLAYWVSLHSLKNNNLFSSAFTGVLTLAALRHGQGAIETFAVRCYTGLGLQPTDSEFHLRNRFINRARGEPVNIGTALSLYIKAVNSYVTRQPMHVLRMRHDEEMPTLV